VSGPEEQCRFVTAAGARCLLDADHSGGHDPVGDDVLVDHASYTYDLALSDYEGALASRDPLFPLAGGDIAITSDDCYTPRWVFDAMGLRFDLDVAAPVGGPWHVPCERTTPPRTTG
jgi:hypothetical protein